MFNDDAQMPSVMATLDYHDDSKSPTHCAHKAVYNLQTTPEWDLWNQFSSEPMSQGKFARFLEDNLPDIADPPGADLLEMATSFEASTKVQFKSSMRLEDGSRQLVYEKQIDGRCSQGSMEVPSTFTLGLSPFRGAKTYKLDARFRYQINEGNLTVWYELVRPRKVFEDACDGELASIAQELSVEILYGS